MKIPSGRTATILAMLLAALLSGCEGPRQEPGGRILAVVDGEAVTEAELDAASGLPAPDGTGLISARDDRRERLDKLIQRKLLIKMARRRGVEDDPEYARAMQRFEEQALITRLLQIKAAEFEDAVTAGDTEVDEYAAAMRYRMAYLESVFYSEAEKEDFLARAASRRPVPWQYERTVAGGEGAGPALLSLLASMDKGEVRSFRRGRAHTVVKLVEKQESLPLQALPDRETVREYLLEAKRSEMLRDWLDSLAAGYYVTYEDE